jgi:aminoglycoside phosphotransferase family enzyme
MWYDSLMTEEELLNALAEADAAAKFARMTRKRHARRSTPTNVQRMDDLNEAMTRVKEAMVPLRSYIGRSPYLPQTSFVSASVDRCRERSAELQKERRKTWKMLQAGKKKDIDIV